MGILFLLPTSVSANQDSLQAEFYLKNAQEFILSDVVDSSEIAFSAALELMKKNGDWSNWIDFHTRMARTFWLKKGDAQKAVSLFEGALSQKNWNTTPTDRDWLKLAKLYANMGYVIGTFQGDFIRVKSVYEHAYNIYVDTLNNQNLAGTTFILQDLLRDSFKS